MGSTETECSQESKSADSLIGHRKKRMKNKRRFSDDQIRLLESMFEEETKLDPRKKVQLARELDLQPRQVAIWFQNKRARWKSKQLERQYSELRASYDALASSFESLKEEKRCLLKQLQKLGSTLGKDPKQCTTGSFRNGSHAHLNGGDDEFEKYEEKRSLLAEEGLDFRTTARSGHEDCIPYGQIALEEAELPSMGENASASIALPEWGDFETCCFSDESCSSLQLWDLWP